jgi:RNA polymerase sigma-70 factor (ECF subfamily)
MSPKDEKTLINLVRKGTYSSFSELYSLWVSKLYRFVYALVKSKESTQDIVQETFVKIWTNRDTLNPDLSFKSYLFTISYHLVLKELKRKIDHPLMEDYMEYCNNENIAVSSYMEERMDFDRFMKELEEAKDKLTPRQRQIFEMNKEGNISISEIATQFGITEQSVRNQLSAALKTLRKELGSYGFFLLFLFGSLGK